MRDAVLKHVQERANQEGPSTGADERPRRGAGRDVQGHDHGHRSSLIRAGTRSWSDTDTGRVEAVQNASVHDRGVGSMYPSERIRGFWGAVRERSAAGARLRRRIVATVAMALFVGGLLVAIGFGGFVLALLAALLIVIAVVAFVAFWPE